MAAHGGEQHARRGHAPALTALALVLVAAVSFGGPPAQAQSLVSSAGAPTKLPAEQGPRWRDLKPAQQAALQPLQQEWSLIEANRKQTWLELAGRFPSMSPVDQSRVQDRMAAWVRMTPQQRGEARLRFQEFKQLPPQDRQARWDAYQALSPEAKEQLATRAVPLPPRQSNAAEKQNGAEGSRDGSPRRGPGDGSPVFNPSMKSVAPTLVQARPGVTTSLVTKRPAPPTHQQPGSPKLTMTPGLINQATLLPRRGPQGTTTFQPVRPPASATPP